MRILFGRVTPRPRSANQHGFIVSGQPLGDQRLCGRQLAIYVDGHARTAEGHGQMVISVGRQNQIRNLQPLRCAIIFQLDLQDAINDQNLKMAVLIATHIHRDQRHLAVEAIQREGQSDRRVVHIRQIGTIDFNHVIRVTIEGHRGVEGIVGRRQRHVVLVSVSSVWARPRNGRSLTQLRRDCGRPADRMWRKFGLVPDQRHWVSGMRAFMLTRSFERYLMF